MKQSMAIPVLCLASLANPVLAADVPAMNAPVTGTPVSGTPATGAPAADNTPLPVTVGAYAQHSADKIVYRYRVTNNSQQDIVAVTVGRDTQNDANPDNDMNELAELPSGWNAKIGIPSTSSNSPTGWHVSVLSPEENTLHAIAWETLNEHSPRIAVGQTVNKMSISLDNADDHYLSGHALVTYADGNPVNLTVPVDRLDTTPPSLAVKLNPDTITAQDNKLVPINASFIIKDDYDRAPQIRLVSITADEPLDSNDIGDASIGLDDRYFKLLASSTTSAGRVYTVTYSATDASGNQTLASATVTVTAPQNQPEPVGAESKPVR